MLQIHTNDNYAKNSQRGIASNSLVLDKPYFLKKASGFIAKATAPTDRIIGVNYTVDSFAPNNQTVAKSEVEFEPKETPILYNVTINGGSVTAADVGSFFNLSDAETVDWTTKATTPYTVDTTGSSTTTPVASKQLELVKFNSATLGVFRIVNL